MTAETLSVASTVLGQPLAEPGRRLGGMAIDLVAIGLLSKPFLGLATGVLLIVLFGSTREAPLAFFDAFIRNGGYVVGVAMGMMGFLKILWEPNRQ